MSGFYIGVDGKARKVKGGYIGIDGKARKIKKGYIGDENGVARLCWSAIEILPVFADNTWEAIAFACQTGSVPDTWEVGDQKTMDIGGTEYTIDIIGKDHDDYADGSGKAPLTFQLHECYATYYNMNTSSTNSGGWDGSYMRSYRLSQMILPSMPSEVQAAIREVNKLTSLSATIASTTDKLFLLSEIEVFNTCNMSYSGEGKQYEYYAAGGASAKHKIGATAGLAWWLRSPAKDSNSFALAAAAGGSASYAYANGSYGVSFAFCF